MEKIRGSIVYLASGMMLTILCLMMFINLEYTCKKTFLLPNFALLLFGIVVISVFTICASKTKLDSLFNKNRIQVASVVLFFLQFYICYNIYFATGWDSSILTSNAIAIARGWTDGLDHLYFSYYPNNIMLVFIESMLVRTSDLFGVFDTNNGPLFFMIILNCLMTTVSGKILFNTILNFTNSVKCSWFGWGGT